MNFYTLTFKSKARVSFFMIFLGLILINSALYLIEINKTTDTSFINKKSSKIRHFKLNNPMEKDIIFLGSSRTFYQVSTEVFRSNGMNVYNFGIPSAEFEDYPTLVPLLIEAHPNEVVISLSVNKLYEKLDISDYPSINEMKYYYDIDKIYFLKSLYQWIINRHLFLQYLEPIFHKIQYLYSKFDIKSNEDGHVLGSTISNYSNLLDCKVFSVKNNGNDRQTLKCTNGDGALRGGLLNKKNNLLSVDFISLNQDSSLFLSKVIKKLSKSMDVTIILEPVLYNEYRYDINYIQEAFDGASIIDLTSHDIITKKEMWFDDKHLNYKGRELYSQYLFSILDNKKVISNY